MFSNLILFAISIFPVLLLGSYIYYKDRFQKEPLKMLLKALLFGCISVLPAMLAEMLLSGGYEIIVGGALPSLFSGLYSGYVVAGCSEELSKLLLLFLAVWRSRYFDEYYDGIVYATFVSLGFAGLENIMYIFGQEDFGSSIATGTMRALLAVPAHFLFGVVMGYYFALAKFQPEGRSGYIVKAFLFPMLLHGTYDSLLMIPEAMGGVGPLLSLGFFILFIYFDIKLWKIGIRRLKELQQINDNSYFSGNSYGNDNGSYNSDDGHGQGNYPQDPFSGFNWNV